jgi:SAM-dependent methyltransferase
MMSHANLKEQCPEVSADARCEKARRDTRMKILVVLVSYGSKNDTYLKRVLDEYRAMSYDVDVVVTSNIRKDLGSDVELVVGLPNKDPWSLPFAHKKIFARRVDRYDLFIYSEDDILITEQNIRAFVDAGGVLDADEIAGFVHAEEDCSGNLYFDPPHASFHWDPDSVTRRGEHIFAFYTNEHAACFMLTQRQLKLAIGSGGFLVEPHEGRYGLAETATTDPYTQCGFKKMVSISHLDQFTVRHLPGNKWSVRPYRAAEEFRHQIRALLALERSGRPKALLFEPETKVPHRKWSKDYYEPVRAEVVAQIPGGVRSVLSIGCAWGAIEGWLVRRGVRVVGVPMDSVIAACAEAKGVEIVYADLDLAKKKLKGQTFDCLLLCSVLHLVDDPTAVLSRYADLLAPGGVVLATVPNFAQLTTWWRRLTSVANSKNLGDYAKAGVHATTPRIIREWYRQCGLTAPSFAYVIPEKGQLFHRFFGGVVGTLLGEELICVGKRRSGISERDRPLVSRLDTAAVDR